MDRDKQKSAPPISNRIQFDDNVLVCPRCDFQYLHHCAVTVYDRHEDAEFVTKTKIRCSDTFFEEPHSETVIVTERSSESRNPSSRRHGLAILFFCEGCHETSELTIAQERGTTILAWRDAVSQHLAA
jgi:hypothetical protein